MMKQPDRAADQAHQDETPEASAEDVYFPASRSRRACQKKRGKNMFLNTLLLLWSSGGNQTNDAS